MGKTTLDIDDLKHILKKEIIEAVREAFDQYEFITEDDLKDRKKALKELSDDEAVEWDEYKKKRGID
ncbi:hypothetical protein JXI42_05390 [bacterium]|nr:hypothetical protein [bacterium]